MTTSISNASTVPALPHEVRPITTARALSFERTKRRHSLASRLAFLTICVMIVMSTLFYGTVHYWALGVFALAAAGVVCFWCVDGLVLRSVRLSLNPLQFPLLGLIVLGLFQLLPLASTTNNAGLSLNLSRSLSLDPYATRLVLVQLISLLVFLMATLVFTDSPHRLRILVRTIIIFGFLLAMFGLTQSFTTDGSRVYWFRQLSQSTAFGPFINRHHFAGYMEMAVAIPLGLLFSGALEAHKRPLYAFAAALMGVSLIMTNSRGGIISLAAEILFLVVIAGPGGRREGGRAQTLRMVLIRTGLAVGLIVVLFVGVLAVGGADVFNRLLGTVNAADPTTGRSHFWSVTVDVIKAHPFIGSGLGSFGVIYTRYDSRNGMFRLEQAHNDYLQILSDAGIVGGLLGLSFLIILFRKGFARRDTGDKFRSGVATGALAGCFAVLVHSAFDFTLHTTANALLFLVLAALATLDSRVDEGGGRRRMQRRRRRRTASLEDPGSLGAAALPAPAATP